MATDAHRPVVELVVLLGSAGALDALSTVLHDLAGEFPAAIVIQQHLGGHASVLPTILRRHTARRVSWAEDGQAVPPGQVVVCPPGMHLELTGDGRCRLREMEEPFKERRFDVLLASVARSYGTRSVAVILSGSGRDGAAGTVAMKRAGAIVIAQSPETAQYASLPIAAARAGADLVLPIYEIGRALADIIEGAPLPKPRPRETVGAAVPLGPLAQWPAQTNGGNPSAAGGQSMDTGYRTTALPNVLSQLSPQQNTPADRAEAARLRAAELRRRRQDLAVGFGATAQTVAAARCRAAESQRRAQLAHQAAQEAAARWGR